MAQITRGTTPRIEIEVDVDLTDYTSYLSIGKVGEELLTIDTTQHEAGEEGKSVLRFDLTQQQTLSLPKGSMKMQVRAIKNDDAIATDLMELKVLDVIKDGVIVDVE